MALVKHVLKGEVRIIYLDEVRLVDTEMIQQCSRELIDVIQKTEEKCVVVSFARVTFLSSMAIGMLVRAKKICKEHKISLILCDIIPVIRELFTITSLDKVFDIRKDVPAALAALAESGQLTFDKKAPSSYELSEG